METKRFKRIQLFLLILILSTAEAQPVFELKSTENQVQLIELFSSEGCSSCPPADRWLSSLRDKSNLWKQFVPVEFHVDYWNRLGWTDPFSKTLFTERQHRYSQEWAKSAVYTPGFVLNGVEWHPTGGTDFLDHQIINRVGVLTAKKISEHQFTVSFVPNRVTDDLQVYAVLMGNGLASKVSSGENSGSILKHDFAVLAFTQKVMNREKGIYTATVDLKSTGGNSAKSYSVAFWVSDRQHQKPIQVVGGDL